MAIASALQPGRDFFIQSDVREVIDPMVILTELSGCFDRPDGDAHPWRKTNPLSVPTERERYVMDQQLPVYRVLFRRNHTDQPPIEALEQRWQEIDNPGHAPMPEA
jgi:tRNA (guanine-N7-)-methyltransferase